MGRFEYSVCVVQHRLDCTALTLPLQQAKRVFGVLYAQAFRGQYASPALSLTRFVAVFNILLLYFLFRSWILATLLYVFSGLRMSVAREGSLGQEILALLGWKKQCVVNRAPSNDDMDRALQHLLMHGRSDIGHISHDGEHVLGPSNI